MELVLPLAACHCIPSLYLTVSIYTVRQLPDCGLPSLNWHNLVNMRFIYIKMSDNIAEKMFNLQA